MLKEDQAWVLEMVKAEVAKIQIPKPSKPVEVDIDGIVKLVLDKLRAVAEKAPKPGKKEI